MDKIWLKQYPAGVPAEIDVNQYASLVALLDESFRRYADRMAYKFMGKSISFRDVDEASAAFAGWLQAQGFAKGDRIAVMMPNVPQYPVAIAAILRAGLVVVNVNPLYTPRELEHQLKDSGAKAIVILENFASVLQQVMAAVPTKKVVLASMGDMLGFPKSQIVTICSPLGIFFSAGWYHASACRMLATRFRCRSTAPLLTPVVPPVYWSTAASSGPTCTGVNGLRRPCARASLKRTAPGSSNAGTSFLALRTT